MHVEHKEAVVLFFSLVIALLGVHCKRKQKIKTKRLVHEIACMSGARFPCSFSNQSCNNNVPPPGGTLLDEAW